MRNLYCILFYGLSVCMAPAQQPLQWDYPCKPGTDCWRALTNVDERQEACQIKGMDLQSLATEELLLIVIEHPFFQSYVAHDSPIEGLNFALENFNGLVEFQRRNDAMKTLDKVYFREDFGTLGIMSDTAAMGSYTLKWIGAELMMANENLLNQLTNPEKIGFLKHLYYKLQEKHKYKEIFGGISDVTSACIFYKVLKSMGHEDFGSAFESEDAELFGKKLIVRDTHTIETLQSQFTDFIRKN